jgi:hypothetical protein
VICTCFGVMPQLCGIITSSIASLLCAYDIMKVLFLILVFSFSSFILGQDNASSTNQDAEKRIEQILTNSQCQESKRYTGYEWFLKSLKKGERGDGVHYSWMDKMRQLGVKQAHFVVHFSYKNGAYKYKVKQIDYLQEYYCSYGKRISGKLLRQIRKSGLEQELKDAIVARIKKYERPYKSGNLKSGESYHYLLDDEYLPIIDYVT